MSATGPSLTQARPTLFILPLIQPTTPPETLATLLAPVLTPSLTQPALDLALPLPADHTFHKTQRTLANLYLALELLQENMGNDVPQCNVAVFFIGERDSGSVRTIGEIRRAWRYRWKEVKVEKGSVWKGEEKGWNEYSIQALDNESKIPYEPKETADQRRAFSNVAVGGTFDHIHAGHRLLLTMTAYLLNSRVDPLRLIVGITGDPLLQKKKYKEYLANWQQRAESTLKFLERIFPFPDDLETKVKHTKPAPPFYSRSFVNIVVECYELLEPAGPLLTDENIDALIVSGETKEGGEQINIQRKEKNWKTVDVFEVDILGERSGGKISSTNYRKIEAERSARGIDL